MQPDAVPGVPLEEWWRDPRLGQEGALVGGVVELQEDAVPGVLLEGRWSDLRLG